MQTPRKFQRRFTAVPGLAALAMLCLWAGIARGDGPATAPAGADTPAVKEVRDQMIEWNKVGDKWTLEQTRRIFHTENEQEESFADFCAHEGWQSSKTQKMVRDKWGPEIEAKFIHLLGGDTIEDDQAADITVDGDHATLNWKVKEITTSHLIKVDGKWLIDMHLTFEDGLKTDPLLGKHNIGTAKLVKDAATDVDAGKYDDGEAFLDDFKPKLQALWQGN